jgi:hypothetical protein
MTIKISYDISVWRRKIMVRHKHADMIHAWADGAEIQVLHCDKWIDTPNPLWANGSDYRVKPQPKPDFEVHSYVIYDSLFYPSVSKSCIPNVRYTFDGETNKLKSAEIIK